MLIKIPVCWIIIELVGNGQGVDGKCRLSSWSPAIVLSFVCAFWDGLLNHYPRPSITNYNESKWTQARGIILYTVGDQCIAQSQKLWLGTPLIAHFRCNRVTLAVCSMDSRYALYPLIINNPLWYMYWNPLHIEYFIYRDPRALLLHSRFYMVWHVN